MEQGLQRGIWAASLIGVSFVPSIVKAQEVTGEDGKPNIIVLLCDDLGYGDLGCFGHPAIQTPNLDALAKSGIRLNDFYAAAPVSSPSRAGLLTGRSPNRAGFYDFIPGYSKSEDCRDLVHLQDYEVTIPQLVKSAGYVTCLSGKWHCSSRFNHESQPRPDHFGFDHWFCTHNNSAPTHQNPNNFVRNGEPAGQLEGFSCQLVVDEAIGWLDKQDGEKPFYLQLTFHEPHEPIASPEHLVQKYMLTAQNRAQAEYFANVENMDAAVGRVVKYIEENGLDNTLILFSSDNGPETLLRYGRASHSYGSPGDLNGMKLWTSDGGIRVSSIINWVGRDIYNGESDAVVSSLDYLPTICEIVGVELPDRDLDGESFVSLIETGSFEREGALVWAFYDALNEQRVAMRSGDWKMLATLTCDGEVMPRYNNLYDGNIEFVKGAKLENFSLYNIREDIGESNDLSQIDKKNFRKVKKQFIKEYERLLEGSHVWSRDDN
ncbi:MAG: sulfatase-like hydrolase/transferase [Rikenellaceae bacterium]